MSKVRIVRDSDGLFYGLSFYCPACKWPDGKPQLTTLPVDWLPHGETKESPYNAGKPHWSFNGDFEKPVFGPSVLEWMGEPGSAHYRCCHSFVGCNGALPGQIVFLSDCTHEFAGQVVDLPDID